MCGIFLYLSKNNIYEKSLKFREKIFKNFSKIQHRGPDNSTFMNVNNKLIFGFHRLAIVDKSIQGNQPFISYENELDSSSEPIIYCMCNGEIYNYKQLILEYNLKPKSDSDCEVILELYKYFLNQTDINFTNELVKKNKIIQSVVFKIANLLDGVFAFQLFDSRYNVLSIGRDPIGVRSLYYGYDANGLCFASEMKGIHKISNHIEFFPPGSVISFNIDDTHSQFKKDLIKNVQKYYYCNYSYKLIENKEEHVEDYYRLNIKNLLTKAVDKRIIGDRPIGCLLSGGLDSSLIAALLSNKLKKLGKKLHTFSIGMKDATDLKYAKMVADHIDSVHHEVIVDELTMFNKIKEVVYQIESWDTTTVRASTPMVLLCEYIKKNTNITVIYSGEGSDEASGSYMYFKNAPDNHEFHQETCRLVKDLQYFDVLRSDKSVSSAGLEVRVPFLDKDFLDFYMSIDPKFKIDKGSDKTDNQPIEKYLLRSSFDDGLLPDEVLWRIKEAFSDGCSSKKKSWYQIIQEFVENSFDEDDNMRNYTHHPPKFQEALYYRYLFEQYFPYKDTIIPYYWLPKWSGDVDDPSARVLDVYNA